ncbi:hypothetical protein BDV93DRAFT_527197 [Ceratobasidium sp. AG-I]|nr:hypothetical protein BDV93DRAFT_527197 [Ceratobasidium sp. AG-I]
MSTPKPKRHPKYYYEDGNVVFLTNDMTLFRLHKSLLKAHSTFFRDMFDHSHLPTKDSEGEDIPIDGSSDDHPIALSGPPLATLEDVELELICDVLFDMPLTPASELRVDQAISLLKVSTKFQFETIHAKVVQTFEKKVMPPWKRYSLAVDCLVDPWILQSYLEICGTVEYQSSELAELILEFSERNEVDRLSNILLIREDYRARLLLFSRGADKFPYLQPQFHPNTSSETVYDFEDEETVTIQETRVAACSVCLIVLKALLARVLSGSKGDLDGADSTKYPLLKDRLLRGIRPRSHMPLKICDQCRPNEAAIIAHVLGLDDLEAEIKQVMNLV